MILERIYNLANEDVQDRNFISNYLQFRNKGNEFDYSAVSGNLISLLMRKRISKKYDFDRFQDDCIAEVSSYLSDPDFKTQISEMYFKDKFITNVSLEFSLFNTQENSSAGSRHLFDIFKSMLCKGDESSQVDIKGDINFIEKIFLDVLNTHLEPFEHQQDCKPYLPFLAEFFHEDLIFLCQYPEYFLSENKRFLCLYSFLYCSQLALNINEFQKEPSSKPLYFILDTEKASQERLQIKDNGYAWLQENIGDLFPVLSLLEYFNRGEQGLKIMPLWSFGLALLAANKDEIQLANQSLELFLERFINSRKLDENYEKKVDPLDTLKTLIDCAKGQFMKETGNTRWEVHENYKRQFSDHIAHHFIQRRGRSGNVLTLNQDNLLLLTNLVIGSKESLRFQELLKSFRARGIWFDKQSEQVLIKFYERIGNVVKMSDSGDAVYVCKTL